MNISYIRKGDYQFPNLYLPVEEPTALGLYGQLRRTFLKEHRQGLYSELLLDGRLHRHLAEIDEASRQAYDRIVDQMKESEGVTESLKSRDQILWIQRMNNIHHRANEIVMTEYVYC